MSGVGWVSEIGAKIRVLGTRILREVWDADFGGFGGSFGLVVGLLDAGYLKGSRNRAGRVEKKRGRWPHWLVCCDKRWFDRAGVDGRHSFS